MVKRGPQFVQLMNGYPNLLSDSDSISARHSSHGAMSGEICADDEPSDLLWWIVNFSTS